MKTKNLFAIATIVVVALVFSSCNKVNEKTSKIPETEFVLVETSNNGASLYGVRCDGKDVIPCSFEDVSYESEPKVFICKSGEFQQVFNGNGAEILGEFKNKTSVVWDHNAFEGFSHWRFTIGKNLYWLFPEKDNKVLSTDGGNLILYPREDVVVVVKDDSLSVLDFDSKVLISPSKKIVFNKPENTIYASENGEDWKKFDWTGKQIGKGINQNDATQIENAMDNGETHADNIWRVNRWKD